MNTTLESHVTTLETTAITRNATAMTSSDINSTTSNYVEETQHILALTWTSIVVGIVLYTIVLVTAIGNILVLVAIYINKRLQTTFNYFIVNLAITDVAVAITAMSFHTTDNFLGYWPFGAFLCGVWIFFDYGMTFASVFTLVLVSVDRFWGVTWTLHYRRHHSKRKTVIALVCMWIFMLVLWLPACIYDRLNNAKPQECIWEPSLNKEFVVVVAVVGHHGSCFILLFCYIKIFIVMQLREQEIKRGSGIKKPEVATVSNGLTDLGKSHMRTYSDVHNVTLRGELSISNDDNSSEKKQPDLRRARKFQHTPKIKKDRMRSHRQKGDRATFIKLTYVIVGYALCWIPFHIVFDVSSVCPSCVPRLVYAIAFWLTYINSTINPFLYNFSAPEFRRTFKRILCRKRILSRNSLGHGNAVQSQELSISL